MALWADGGVVTVEPQFKPVQEPAHKEHLTPVQGRRQVPEGPGAAEALKQEAGASNASPPHADDTSEREGSF